MAAQEKKLDIKANFWIWVVFDEFGIDGRFPAAVFPLRRPLRATGDSSKSKISVLHRSNTGRLESKKGIWGGRSSSPISSRHALKLPSQQTGTVATVGNGPTIARKVTIHQSKKNAEGTSGNCEQENFCFARGDAFDSESGAFFLDSGHTCLFLVLGGP